MASRYADNSRSRYDDRRGGRPAPRRDDRYRDRRDDRRDDRLENNFDDRRDRDRNSYAPSRRRSRSPVRRPDRGRLDRSRDRYDDRPRRERDRERDRSFDSRGGDSYRRGDRSRDRARGPGFRQRSYSGDRRRGSDASSRGDRREPEKPKDDPKAAQQAKLAKLAAWKKEQEAKKKAAQAQSPAATAPATPIAASTPPTREATQEPAKESTETSKQAPKAAFKLDESAKVKPLQIKPVGQSVGPTRLGNGTSTIKPHGNMSAFGLKSKLASEVKEEKNALLDDEDSSGKRTLQALPDLAEGSSPAAMDDAAMSDIASDDEEQLQIRLQQRREEAAIEETEMKDAPPAVEQTQDRMDVDQKAGGEEEDDVDPLDAFMAGLSAPPATSTAPQGQAMFADDHEPDMHAVEGEDLLALTTAKKKRKDIPVVDHTKITYLPFRRNFYNEPREISEMTPEEVADLRLELDGIKVKPVEGTPRPVVKWAQMGLLQQTIDVFHQLGFAKPTPIQSQAIPVALAGRDLFGVAKTGSGKTLAFGIPIIRHILDQPPLKSADGPIVLIMAPTRELVVQIQNELKPFLKASNLKIASAYGGPPISEHIAMIKRGGFSALVATPGRLIDLLQSNSGRVLNFKRTTYVVLDEADRMFDQGFEPQIKKILASIRPDRQTVLFSATQPKHIVATFRKFITNPVEVVIGGRSVVAPEITQVVKVIKSPFGSTKLNQVLLHLGNLFHTGEEADVRALIFVERQEGAEDLLSKLMKKGYSCDAIHGNRDQQDRSDAISDFKKGALPILIATSVAARGLDVPQVRLVINYDCPSHLEDYVHRCGRTGRAGNTGTAITLIEQPGQERFAIHVAKALRDSGQEVPEALLKMTEVFAEKVKSGEERWYDPGFGGKGLDRLDQARAMEKRREKRARKGEFGDESDSEPEEVPAVKKLDTKTATAETPGAPGASNEEEAWQTILKSGIVVNKTERPAPGDKNMSNAEKARAAAAAINARLGQKGRIHHGQPIDNKGPDAGAFHSTLEINGFPQRARWAVTNRTNVAKILDATGTSITTKGNYYPAGKTPGENEQPPLYILVEGESEHVVHSAMSELMRLLKEGTLAAQEEANTRGPTGRYNVI